MSDWTREMSFIVESKTSLMLPVPARIRPMQYTGKRNPHRIDSAGIIITQLLAAAAAAADAFSRILLQGRKKSIPPNRYLRPNHRYLIDAGVRLH